MQQTVNTLAQAQQVRCRGDDRARCRRARWRRDKIGPRNGNVRAAAVRQDKHEVGSSFMTQFGEDFEHLAFEGMVRASHANLGWEVSEGGSLS